MQKTTFHNWDAHTTYSDCFTIWQDSARQPTFRCSSLALVYPPIYPTTTWWTPVFLYGFESWAVRADTQRVKCMRSKLITSEGFSAFHTLTAKPLTGRHRGWLHCWHTSALITDGCQAKDGLRGWRRRLSKELIKDHLRDNHAGHLWRQLDV